MLFRSLRLFKEGLPIASFSKAKLGKRGRVVGVDEPDGARLRNTLHNRLITDAFVPGGGRPATIDDKNWSEFLTSDGVPSSKVISEGANLFLTPEARRQRIQQDLRIDAYKGIALHEIGHSLGLYHLPVSSYDSMNYNPQYWQLRTNNGSAEASRTCTPV